MHPRHCTFLLPTLLLAMQALGSSIAWAHGDHRFHSHPEQEEPESAHEPGYGWPGYVPGSTSVYGPAAGVGISAYGGRDGVDVGLYVPLYLGPAHDTRPAMLYPLRGAAGGIHGANYGHGCEDVREYHTEIAVNGVLVPAFGNACLQGDGSWRVLTGPVVAVRPGR